ncbi:MAG: GHKL domain-containing protein [Solobacterium sp.]|jgi:signal transduction histidine kinase|nr:GHKL domain-containing protein [Solobacterium sp.]MCH4223280.1 GHKL domain-containing protein [Solobacterium sp.]MCH4266618.1 GHKL domain-containing protein [Solobacterium sp.]
MSSRTLFNLLDLAVYFGYIAAVFQVSRTQLQKQWKQLLLIAVVFCFAQLQLSDGVFACGFMTIAAVLVTMILFCPKYQILEVLIFALIPLIYERFLNDLAQLVIMNSLGYDQFWQYVLSSNMIQIGLICRGIMIVLLLAVIYLKRQFKGEVSWQDLTSILIIKLLVQVILYYVEKQAFTYRFSFMGTAVILILLMVMDSAAMFLFYRMQYQVNIQIAQNLRMEQLQYEMKDYRSAAESDERIRELRHDFRHLSSTVNGYLKDGDKSRAEALLQNYESKLQKSGTYYHSNNEVINMVLSRYRKKADEEGINLKIYSSYHQRIKMNDLDLNAILCNLLENAFLYVGTGRQIDVELTDRGQYVQLKTTNCTEADSFQMGTGLSSVQRTVKTSGGSAEFWIDSGMFNASVLIPSTQETAHE